MYFLILSSVKILIPLQAVSTMALQSIIERPIFTSRLIQYLTASMGMCFISCDAGNTFKDVHIIKKISAFLMIPAAHEYSVRYSPNKMTLGRNYEPSYVLSQSLSFYS